MTEYDQTTGLPKLPDGHVWYVYCADDIGFDPERPSPPDYDGVYNIKIRTKTPRGWPFRGYTHADTRYSTNLTTFDGRLVERLSDLSADIIRAGAERLIDRMNREKLDRRLAENRAHLLGYYPPTTLRTTK